MMTTDMLNEDHSRTIIHIDLDCFYAQVEMLKNPKLKNEPLGVQQKNIVVTSNYIAREFGIKKCMLVTEAQKLCPKLTLVKEVVKLRMNDELSDKVDVVGNVYGSASEECECGCVVRLNIGSIIAAEMRQVIRDELGLTCCAGIAHNKLLAKLGGAANKPDKQTIVYPSNAGQLLYSLTDVRAIPGIGASACETLKSVSIHTVDDLRQCPLDKLKQTLGADKAQLFMDLCYGRDMSPVKISGRPQSIGLEDSCKSISVETEVHDKFRQLLHRLMVLVGEDGRIPRTLKMTVRKFDTLRQQSHREQRQCNISPTLFSAAHNTVQLAVGAEDKIMVSIMHLFHKLVNISRPFHVTLLGLAFTKFQERLHGKHSIASFLMKNLSVQSITSLQSNTASGTTMDYSPVSQHHLSTSDFQTDGSESEVEPSPKKTKLGTLIVKRRCLDMPVECPSPSKLRVAELRLSSRDSLDQSPSSTTTGGGTVVESTGEFRCPDNVDPEVFKELPVDVQNELLQQWKLEQQKKTSTARPPLKKQKTTNTLLGYLIKNK
ncbi:DNA polymerase iota [Carabus blaptoides fortunei]